MCENNVKIMADILACRICLGTDGNLYNMYDYGLITAFEDLTGISMTVPDNYPHYLCTYCQHLLLKSSIFKERCVQSLKILKSASMEVPVLTLQHIQNLSLSNSLSHSFSICPLPLCTIESSTANIEIKEETNNIDLKEELSDQSDEEPLAKKVTKKKQKKINYSEFEFGEDSVEKNAEYSEFENDNEKDVDCTEFDFETDAFETTDFEQGSNNLVTGISEQDTDVIILSKEEQIQEVLDRKESYNYQNSFYKCELCFKGFITDTTFKNHMMRHDPSTGPHACEICHTRWSELRSLKSHYITAHERKYICKLCNHVDRTLNRAKEHIRYHRGHTYICKLCGSSFAMSTSYLTHVRLHHPSKFCCDVCGESFIGQLGLNMHKKKTHKLCRDRKQQIYCGLCNTKFKSLEALERHTNSFGDGVCDNSQCPCSKCGENFSTPELLQEHLKTHLDTVRCEECNRVFSNERSFAAHCHRVHHLGVKPKHKRMVARRRPPAVCEICGKKCISNANLVYHQRTHTGEKPYQCTECPKSFSVFQRLQIHIRTHTGESPFKCSHCPKAFKHKAALNRHDRVHTGEKPYQCAHCSKSFSQSNSMKLHVRTVHLKLPAPYRNRAKNKKIPE